MTAGSALFMNVVRKRMKISTRCRDWLMTESFQDTEEHGLRATLGPSGRQKPCTRIRSVFVRVLPCPEMFCDPFFMNKTG
jgi:hypothetical protein